MIQVLKIKALVKEVPAHDLPDKIWQRCRIQNSTKYKSEDCTIEMGIMINTVIRFSPLIIGKDKVQGAKNETRHANSEV